MRNPQRRPQCRSGRPAVYIFVSGAQPTLPIARISLVVMQINVSYSLIQLHPPGLASREVQTMVPVRRRGYTEQSSAVQRAPVRSRSTSRRRGSGAAGAR